MGSKGSFYEAGATTYTETNPTPQQVADSPANAAAAAASAASAASSQSAASTSATNAANSATAASNSASSAASSASSALSTLTTMRNIFLGAFATAPTLDNSGNALQAGEWYFNTTLIQTQVYTGSGWQIIGPQFPSRLWLQSNTTYYVGTAPASVTISIASPGVVTWANHGLAANAPVVFSGTVPTGLSKGVIYFVVGSSITTNTFEVSATAGGAAINTSGTSSGVTARTGSDSNNGSSNSRANAFLTIQGAVNYVMKYIDIGANQVAIQLADGFWLESVGLGSYVGRGFQGHNVAVIIQGNTFAPTNVTVSSPNTGAAFTAVETGGMEWCLSSMVLTSSTGGGVLVDANSWLVIGPNMTFGTCATTHMSCENFGLLEIWNSFSVTGGANCHIQCQFFGYVLTNASIVGTFTGTPAFSGAVIYADVGGVIADQGVSWSGAATGLRYFRGRDAKIYTPGNVDPNTRFPGSTNGQTGAVYFGNNTGGSLTNCIGELITLTTSSTSLVSAPAGGTQILAQTLQPGVWEIGGTVTYSGTATSVAYLMAGLTTSPTGLGTSGSALTDYYNANIFGTFTTFVRNFPPQTITITTATNYYIAVYTGFSGGTCAAAGYFWARRVA